MDFLIQQSDRGFPATREKIYHYALEIAQIRHPELEKLGKNFVDRFIQRNWDRISTKWSANLDTSRASAVNPVVINHWYELLNAQLGHHHFHPSNIYGLDESGFPFGTGEKVRVVSRKGRKTQHIQRDGNRENVDWSLGDSPPKRYQTHVEMEDLLRRQREALRNAQEHKVAAAQAIDATNAQLALSGMVLTRARNQLSAHEAKKNKTKTHCIKNTFGRVVTHQSITRAARLDKEQRERNDADTTGRRELTAAWREFKKKQDSELAAWRTEKDRCQKVDQRVPPRPKLVLKKEWIAQHSTREVSEYGSDDGGNEEEGGSGGEEE